MQNLHKEIEIFPFHNNQIPNSNVLSFHWTLFHSKLMNLGFQIQCFHCSTVSMNIYEEHPKLHVPHIQNLHTVVSSCQIASCVQLNMKCMPHSSAFHVQSSIICFFSYCTYHYFTTEISFHSPAVSLESYCQTHLRCNTLQLCVFFLLYYSFCNISNFILIQV